MHAFVDESERNGRYLMCAVLVAPRDLVIVRRALVALCLPGQRRLHLTKERPPRKRMILSRVTALPVRARLYSSPGRPPAARIACLRALITDIIGRGVDRLVIEPVESHTLTDRSIIINTAQRYGVDNLVYEHLEARFEPVLWASDAVAWAHGAGGDWGRRVAAVIEGISDAPTQRETRIPTVRRRPGPTSKGLTPRHK